MKNFDDKDISKEESASPADESVNAVEGDVTDGQAPSFDAPEKDKKGKRSRFKERFAKSQLQMAAIAHFDNRSFLALLLRSFLSFMIITVAATLLIVVIATWASNNNRINISIQNIDSYSVELKNNPTAPSIPTEVIFGYGGWLDIVDADSGELIYSSSGSKSNYTPAELVCICDFNEGADIKLTRFHTESGEASGDNYFVSKSYDDGTDTPDEYILLSPSLDVVSTNMAQFAGKATFTARELEFLTYNSSHGGDIIEKYAFVTRDGVRCYAIYLDTNNDEVSPPWLFIIITIIGLVALLISTLALYIRYINKHVQRPLKALSEAMEGFARSGYRGKLDYIGSKDFEQLIDTFNEMVSLLNASEEQRKSLEQDRQRMLAGLSHDLKTPMTVIEGFSKAIRDGVVSEEDKPKYLNLIISKSEHMSELITEFYEYSKLDHPDFALNKQRTDMAEFARSFLASKYDEFDINGYLLEANICDEPQVCDVDRDQFTRVFDNLVGNFFKYTPKGSKLMVSVAREDDSVCVYLADNGGGIPAEARKDIFEPFVVAEQSRNRQGSGLGLAVCKKIVEAHGGAILLLDGEDKGTRFKITLPLLGDEEK